MKSKRRSGSAARSGGSKHAKAGEKAHSKKGPESAPASMHQLGSGSSGHAGSYKP